MHSKQSARPTGRNSTHLNRHSYRHLTLDSCLNLIRIRYLFFSPTKAFQTSFHSSTAEFIQFCLLQACELYDAM